MEATKDDDETQTTCRYLRLFPNSNSTTRGTVSFPRGFGDDEFISYNVEADDSMVLISKIGAKEYLCHGTCFCVENRRRQMKMIGLSILVAGLGFYFAQFSAKSGLIDRCQKLFEKDSSCEGDIEVDDISCSEIEDVEHYSEDEDLPLYCKGKVECRNPKRENNDGEGYHYEEIGCDGIGIINKWRDKHFSTLFDPVSTFIEKTCGDISLCENLKEGCEISGSHYSCKLGEKTIEGSFVCRDIENPYDIRVNPQT